MEGSEFSSSAGFNFGLPAPADDRRTTRQLLNASRNSMEAPLPPRRTRASSDDAVLRTPSNKAGATVGGRMARPFLLSPVIDVS